MDDFWNEYEKDLKKGYYKEIDGKRCLKEEFIVKYPQEIVKRLRYNWKDKKTTKNKNKNKLSQLWKFYDFIRRIQNSLYLNDESLDILKADLYQLMPAVNYAFERETISDDFKKFIDLNVTSVKNREDLDAFIKHFQSLIAYLPKENQK